MFKSGLRLPVRDNSVQLNIYQGEFAHTEKCLLIGSYQFPLGVAEVAKIAVRDVCVNIDANDQATLVVLDPNAHLANVVRFAIRDRRLTVKMIEA
jgi:hypothetical protein